MPGLVFGSSEMPDVDTGPKMEISGWSTKLVPKRK